MDSGRLIFDPSRDGNVIFFGDGGCGFNGSKRRPFFSSPDDYFEEYYDEQLPEKKRRLTPEQVHVLEMSFEVENKLEPDRKTQLAKNLGLQPRQVTVWFQNRRARWKMKQLERDFHCLKSSYDSLLSDYNTVSKENDALRSEVDALIMKLHKKEPMPVMTDHKALSMTGSREWYETQ